MKLLAVFLAVAFFVAAEACQSGFSTDAGALAADCHQHLQCKTNTDCGQEQQCCYKIDGCSATCWDVHSDANNPPVGR